MPAVKHFMASLRRRSLKLRIGGINEVFDSPQELALFLGTRLAVPSERLDTLARLDVHGLHREARKMAHAHQNLVDVMVSAKETGEPLGNLWRRLDISKVPDDHDWPSILFALGNVGSRAEDYRREALSQYLQFLEVRRDALDSFRPSAERPEHDAPRVAAASTAAAAPVPAPGRRGSLTDYSRLPHCHAVEVDLEDKTDITVLLGGNRYRLAKQGDALVLREGRNRGTYPLKPGRNTVGRSSRCDVHLDSHNSDVSRQHLIVEVNPDLHVSLMDVSSRGTYVRPELVGISGRSDTTTERPE